MRTRQRVALTVNLTHVGGNGGTATTPVSFTYDIAGFNNSTLFGNAVSPHRGSPGAGIIYSPVRRGILFCDYKGYEMTTQDLIANEYVNAIQQQSVIGSTI